MFDQFYLGLSPQNKKQKERVFKALEEKYKDYRDPWGFNLDTIKKDIEFILPIYKNYFKVRVFGLENLKDKPYMMVSNHTGQLPIDAALITLAMAFEPSSPRIIHSMIERFMAALPFIGDFAAQSGAILGDRANCKWLLDKGESILVFPEGVKGINKKTKDFYKLQHFSSGFYRIALKADVPILPITVIGAEEMFPIVFQAPKLGKVLGLPNLPLPLNLFPLPSPIDIYIGEEVPLGNEITAESTESELRPHIRKIENTIKSNIVKGLDERRQFGDWLRKPINEIMKKF